MSIVKRQQEERKDRKKTRKFQRIGGDSSRADWARVDMAQIQETIAYVTRAGGAIRFGYTADGGAYALGVYGDGSTPYTEYVRPGEDIERVLADIGAAFIDDDAEEIQSERTAGQKPSPTAQGKAQGKDKATSTT
ncbi:MAG: hypothetical protein ACOYD4_18400 [Solirubrobacterales bacterium]